MPTLPSVSIRKFVLVTQFSGQVPDVVVTLDRRAIAAVATEIEVEPEEDGEDEPASGIDAEPR